MDKKQKLAQALEKALIIDVRNNGEQFIRLADNSPEWVNGAIRAAHGEFGPDDKKYSMIRECAGKLAEYDSDDWEDYAGEMADSLVDIYNADLLHWLSSHLFRAFYCDEAQEEGLVSADAEMYKRIAIGQYMEYQEILYSLIQSISKQADEENEE